MNPVKGHFMTIIRIESKSCKTREVALQSFPVRLGRDSGSDVVLSHWRVGRNHAVLHRAEDGLRIVDLGCLGGTKVNGERVAEFGPIVDFDRIEIGGFSLQLRADQSSFAVHRSRDDAASGGDLGADLYPKVRLSTPESDRYQPRRQWQAEGESVNVRAARLDSASLAPSIASSSVLDREAQELNKSAQLDWQRRLHRALIESMDLRRHDVHQLSDQQLRLEAAAILAKLMNEHHVPPTEIDRDVLATQVLDEALGLGPLEPILADPSITEIMVNGADAIWVERDGKLQPSAARFTSDEAIRSVIERIVAPLGRRIDESSPMVDARLPDGSRVNAIIPPLAVRGPALTIRRFARKTLEVDDLVRLGTASASMMAFLRVCIAARRNLIVSGGTGSGKTTLLNVLSNLISPDERLITSEDAAELRLSHPHLVTLEARPPNLEGRGAITIRDLVRNALRMRPDRVIIGECRGGEALDMLQAMNTGHEGSLTTVHANSARDALSRLEVMVLMADLDLPIAVVREQIASAVDLVVHQVRGPDGVRRITSIVEVTGMESGRLQTQELFQFLQSGLDESMRVQGEFECCQSVPHFYEELAQAGWKLDYRLFQPQ